MPRILVVEDDEVTAREIVAELGAHGMVADWAATGCAALERVLGGDYDLITLDRMLPGMSGEKRCQGQFPSDDRSVGERVSGTISGGEEKRCQGQFAGDDRPLKMSMTPLCQAREAAT